MRNRAGMARATEAPRSPLVIDVSRPSRRPGSFLGPSGDGAQSRSGSGPNWLPSRRVHHSNSICSCRRCRRACWSAVLVSAPTVGECARCLTALTGDVEIDLTELYAYPDSTTDETTEADEMGRVGASGQADTVDLEQPIIDAVGLALPFSPLAPSGLPGPVPRLRGRARDRRAGAPSRQD